MSERNSMKTGIQLVAGVLVVGALLLPQVAFGQLSKCKAKVSSKNGTIAVSAKDVSGQLLWGIAAGAETNSFFDEANCGAAAGPSASKCGLADPSDPTAITPPPLCTLYMRDQAGAGDQCSTYIRGCTPGLRGDLDCMEVKLADTFANGASWNRVPLCPSDRVVAGGGYSAAPSLGVEWVASQTFPSLNGYFCQGKNSSGGPVDVECVAQCCKQDALDCTEVKLTDTFPNGSGWNRTPTCPADRVVTGGGYSAAPSLGVEWVAAQTFPALNAYFCQGNNASGGPVDVECVARCCK